MVKTVTNCNLQRIDLEYNELSYPVYTYHGFLEADDFNDVETAYNEVLAFDELVNEPIIEFLGRSPSKRKDIYYVNFMVMEE